MLRRFSWYDGQPPMGQEKSPYETALTSTLLNCLANGQPIPLLLPSAPWKNPNQDKVLSPYPDLGEELGLARLNMLCEELQKVYLYGAVLVLVSDGPAYNGSFSPLPPAYEIHPKSSYERGRDGTRSAPPPTPPLHPHHFHPKKRKPRKKERKKGPPANSRQNKEQTS